MTPSQARKSVILERLAWIEQLLAEMRDLPLADHAEFTSDPLIAAASESYLRRSLEALLDIGRHILAKGYARAAPDYKSIAMMLGEVGVLTESETRLFRMMAGYRNRLVHFYDEVSKEELFEICSQQLDDIERVSDVFRRWMIEHPDKVDSSL